MKDHLTRVELQQSVDGFGRGSRCLAETVGSPTRRGGQEDALPGLREDLDDGANQGGLARTRAAGNDQQLRVECAADGFDLLRR